MKESPCSDCVNPCTEECLGHRTEEEAKALQDYLIKKFQIENGTFPESNLDDAIERWR